MGFPNEALRLETCVRQTCIRSHLHGDVSRTDTATWDIIVKVIGIFNADNAMGRAMRVRFLTSAGAAIAADRDARHSGRFFGRTGHGVPLSILLSAQAVGAATY